MNGAAMGEVFRAHDARLRGDVLPGVARLRHAAARRLALGLDRICALLAGETSIHEVIPFPKTTPAVDLMCDARPAVDPRQLCELHIRTV